MYTSTMLNKEEISPAGTASAKNHRRRIEEDQQCEKFITIFLL